MRWTVLLWLLYLFNPNEVLADSVDGLKLAIISSNQISVKLDNLSELNERIGWEEPDSLIYYCTIVQDHQNYESSKEAKTKVNYYLGRAFRSKGLFPSSIRFFQKSIDFSMASKDSMMLGNALNQHGLVNLFSGNLQQSITSLVKAKEIYQYLKLDNEIANVNNGIASYYLDTNQTTKAIEKYHEAMDTYVKLNDTLGRANVHANLGLTYIDLHEFEKAKDHLLVQGHLDSLLKSEWGLGFHYDFMGLLYQEMGEFEEALMWHRRGLKIREKHGSTINIGESKMSICKLLLKQNKYEQVKTYAEEILHEALKNKSLYQQQSAYEYLAICVEKLGDLPRAIDYNKKFKILTDSIYQESQAEELAKKEAVLSELELMNEVKMLNDSNQIQKNRLGLQKMFLIALGIAAIVLGGLLYFLFVMNEKLNIKNSAVQESLEEKEVMLKEIHHRVKNNLQVVSSLLSMHSRGSNSSKVRKAFQKARGRIQSMALVHQDLYEAENLSKVELGSYMDKLVTDIFHANDLERRNIKLLKKIDSLFLDLDSMIPIGLITSELINQSLEHSIQENGTIEIEMKSSNDQMTLSYRDDGIGVNEEKIKEEDTIGLKLIEAFAKKLKAKYILSSKQGTDFTLVMNNLQKKPNDRPSNFNR